MVNRFLSSIGILLDSLGAKPLKTNEARLSMVGPGVVPRHGDFNNLDCQTGLTGVTGAKGIFRCCQISRAMICPIGSGTNAARSNLLTESN
jgi:hypothetical protein